MKLDGEEAKQLFAYYRKNRNGIRLNRQLASVCLICGSIHVVPCKGEEGKLVCRNCGFEFFRYRCSTCGETVDGRDPMNPGCRECGIRICTCRRCNCSSKGVAMIPAGSWSGKTASDG